MDLAWSGSVASVASVAVVTSDYDIGGNGGTAGLVWPGPGGHSVTHVRVPVS